MIEPKDWSLVVLHFVALGLAAHLVEFAPFTMCLVMAGNIWFIFVELRK